MSTKIIPLLIASLAIAIYPVSAAGRQEAPAPADAKAAPAVSRIELPVTRVALFSSGVGYFEHAGSVVGDATIGLPFRSEEVNDALKSLVVYALEGNGSPSVSYPSRQDAERGLKAFRVDLSGSPKTATLLARMKGAELSAVVRETRDETIVGRILTVEPAIDGSQRIFLTLLCADGVKSIPFDRIVSFRFTDPDLVAEFDRALAFVGAARDATRTTLDLRLPGEGAREASLGYVVAAPVWKATYRLDLTGQDPVLQGWAVVDNATDRDWRGVELSLISGRPVSFIQDLYSPFYVERPVVPLAIAGTAAPRSFAGGIGGTEAENDENEEKSYYGAGAVAELAAPAPAMASRSAPPSPSPRKSLAGAAGSSAAKEAGGFEAAAARSAGDQFEFTIKRPVDLDRGRSALLPLISGPVDATRVSVYTAGGGRPLLGARLSNSAGMKLPAGPIAVFDDGVYSGDALLDFLNEKDRRLIAFGEDLALTAEESSSTSQETIGVTVSKGVMTFSRRLSRTKTYSFRNAGARDKKLIVEHPESYGSELFKPAEFLEKANGKYRFSLDVAAGKENSLAVVERTPARETVALAPLGIDAFVRYSSSGEIPEAVRTALARAADLKRKVEDATRSSRDIQTRKNELAADQGRVRDNLSSLGRESAEGKRYLVRLLDLEAEIDRLNSRLEESRRAALEAQAAYEAYIAALTL